MAHFYTTIGVVLEKIRFPEALYTFGQSKTAAEQNQTQHNAIHIDLATQHPFPSLPPPQRLSVFRDDIVFLIFLYQRWIYRVDKTRANEFGFAEAEAAAAAAAAAAAGESTEVLPAAAAANGAEAGAGEGAAVRERKKEKKKGGSGAAAGGSGKEEGGRAAAESEVKKDK